MLLVAGVFASRVMAADADPFLASRTFSSELTLHAVPLPVHSYRLLNMTMDEAGNIWTGSIHQLIHRYDPLHGTLESIPLPYRAAAASCLCAGKKVYILGQAYPKLIIYDRGTHKFREVAYPSSKPNAWYGTQAADPRYLYLFDRQSSGVIKWDTRGDTYLVVPYPFKTVFPSSGRYDARDNAIWCPVINLTDDLYAPIGIARLDLASDRFTNYYPFPKDDVELKPYTDADTTSFWAHNLGGKLMPFDFKARRFCKFLDVPRFGKDFGFIGGPTAHHGRYYYSLSTFSSRGSCDGKPHHFLNVIMEFDPASKAFQMLKLETKGSYYQVAYLLSARGHFYATAANILEPDGSLNMNRRGETMFWQTIKPTPGSSELKSR